MKLKTVHMEQALGVVVKITKPVIDFSLMGAAFWACSLCMKSPMFNSELETPINYILVALMLFTELAIPNLMESLIRYEKASLKMNLCFMGFACWGALRCVAHPMFEPTTETVVSAVLIALMLCTELTVDDYVAPLLPLLLKCKQLIEFAVDLQNYREKPEESTAASMKRVLNLCLMGAAWWAASLCIASPIFEPTTEKIINYLFLFLMVVTEVTVDDHLMPVLLPLLSKCKSVIQSVEDSVNNNENNNLKKIS